MGPLGYLTLVNQHFWRFLRSQTLWRRYGATPKYGHQKYRRKKIALIMIAGTFLFLNQMQNYAVMGLAGSAVRKIACRA